MVQMIPKLLSAFAVVVLGSCAGGENDAGVAEPELLDSHYGDGEPMWVGRATPLDAVALR